MTRFAARRPAVCAALLTFITGCSTVAGQPTAQPALWDPCTIPSDAIAAAGVDPTIRDGGALDLDDSEWDECMYRQDWYFVIVQSSVVSYQEVLDDPRSEGFDTALVGGRTGVTYHDVDEDPGDACNLALPYSHGTLVISIDKAGGAARVGDACERAISIAAALAPHLPT